MNGLNTNLLISLPFLPESKNSNIYTLILDLDETLVHFIYVSLYYNWINPNKIYKTPSGGTFLLRPGVQEFLEALKNEYEVVIFTAAMKDV